MGTRAQPVRSHRRAPGRRRDIAVVVAVLLVLACVDLALLAVLTAAGPGWAATGARLVPGSLAEQAGGFAQALRFGLVARSRSLPTG